MKVKGTLQADMFCTVSEKRLAKKLQRRKCRRLGKILLDDTPKRIGYCGWVS